MGSSPAKGAKYITIMTKIRVISSSSSANGYILECGEQSLILELGCKMLYYVLESKDISGSIVGCCVSHAHSDHLNKSTAKEMMFRGIPVYVGEKVYEELSEDANLKGIKRLPIGRRTRIEGFTIQPFPVPHNVPNYGFLIVTPAKERILFVTDAMECKYKFKDIDCIMVECNHDYETLLWNIDKEETSMSHPEYHLSLDDCIDFCKHNASVTTKQIILIHTSHTNLNETKAMQTISRSIPHTLVSVAHSGDVFKIESDNF